MVSMLTTDGNIVPQDEVDKDIAFLKDKLANTTDPEEKDKIAKRLQLLEDAVVIYRITHSKPYHPQFDDVD